MRSNQPLRALFFVCGALLALPRSAAAQVAAGACAAGRADCDADAANGCETTVTNSSAHCGACGQACGAGLVCDGGACRHDEAQHLFSHRMVRTPQGMACITTDTGQTAVRRSTLTPLTIPGITDAVQIAAGEEHACVVRATGGVACWGWDFSGGLGDGGRVARSLPVEASGVHGAVQIRAAGNHGCARLADGHVACWGANGFGEAGSGSIGPSAVAGPVRWLDDATDIALGADFACARRATGAIVCWGQG